MRSTAGCFTNLDSSKGPRQVKRRRARRYTREESDYPLGWQSFSHCELSLCKSCEFAAKRTRAVWQVSCLLQECNAEVGGALALMAGSLRRVPHFAKLREGRAASSRLPLPFKVGCWLPGFPGPDFPLRCYWRTSTLMLRQAREARCTIPALKSEGPVSSHVF